MQRRTLSVASTLLLLGALHAGSGTAMVSSPGAIPDDVIRLPVGSRVGGADASRRRPPAPGEVEIAQYGQFEDMVTFRSAGFKAVRFDPPFEPPYTITKITFPSVTTNGVPAVFPSVRLCEFSEGRIALETPIFERAPFSASSDGENEVAINLTVTDPDRVFFWCVEFPSSATASFPDDFPFLRMDFKDLERGLFASSYDIQVSPTFGALPLLNNDRNIVVSMSCRLLSSDLVPLEAPRNLGANLLSDAAQQFGRVEFSFLPTRNIRADGSRAPAKSLARTELLNLNSLGQWAVVAGTEDAAAAAISIGGNPHLPLRGWVWATQSVDKSGRRSLVSNIVWLPLPYPAYPFFGSYEPNGSLDDATAVLPPTITGLNGDCFPAGDQDFYSFFAEPGDVIDAHAGVNGQRDGVNDLDLVMFLYDSTGRIVSSDDNSGGLLSPHIVHRVRPMSGGPEAARPERFTIQIADKNGSRFQPDAAPRVLVNATSYTAYVYVLPDASESARTDRTKNAELSPRAVGTGGHGSGIYLRFVVPTGVGRGRTKLRIFDVRGRHVRTLVDENVAAGVRTVWWDGTDAGGRRVASGTYYSRVEVGDLRTTLKLTIQR